MRKFLLLVLFLLACLAMNSMFVGARWQVTTIWNTTIWIHAAVPDTEKYILDDEANEDKLYCKTKTDSQGIVIQTDWYNFCSGDFVRSEKADTCTSEFRYPEYECEFAKGSNADKVYCRTVRDAGGTIVETRWFNYCDNELTKTEEGDTCTDEFKKAVYKCYKEELEEPEVCEEEWVCTKWSECVDEEQTRECTDKNECGTTKDKPIEKQTCEMPSYCGDGVCDIEEDCAACAADCGCEEGMKCVNSVCVKKSNLPYVLAGLGAVAIICLVLYLKVFKKKQEEVKEEKKKSKK